MPDGAATGEALLPVRLTRGRTVLGPKARRLGARALLALLLAAGGAAMLFPFAWMISTSLKPDLAVFATPPQLVPHPFQPGNYSKVVHVFPVWRFLLNSSPGLSSRMDPWATSHSSSERGAALRALCSANRSMRFCAITGVISPNQSQIIA